MTELRDAIDLVIRSHMGRHEAENHAADMVSEIMALVRTCDLCDEPDKATLRCNECAQIMASDY